MSRTTILVSLALCAPWLLAGCRGTRPVRRPLPHAGGVEDVEPQKKLPEPTLATLNAEGEGLSLSYVVKEVQQVQVSVQRRIALPKPVIFEPGGWKMVDGKKKYVPPQWKTHEEVAAVYEERTVAKTLANLRFSTNFGTVTHVYFCHDFDYRTNAAAKPVPTTHWDTGENKPPSALWMDLMRERPAMRAKMVGHLVTTGSKGAMGPTKVDLLPASVEEQPLEPFEPERLFEDGSTPIEPDAPAG